jgi:eukaryotic-like serine/threonine-protein kinase
MNSSLIADLPRWRRVNSLLQEALALPQEQHEPWLARLTLDDSDVSPLLRALLARHAVETDAFMSRPVTSSLPKAAEDAHADDEPGDVIGPYQLLRPLGAGGMGSVWLAERTDASPQRQVAVKLPLRGWARGVAERLKQERDTLAGLEHPNIARLYDAGITPTGRPYLAMEFVDGVPIDTYSAENQLALREKLALFLQVAGAVAYAHGRLVVHRDLKPSNILVTRNGDVRLLDFGAAKLLRDDEIQSSLLTQEMGRALSPDYASPEQIQGETITVACDVYSLGIILFELLTGQRPYKLKRHSTAALQAAIVQAEVPLASTAATDRKLCRELRGDLDNVVAKALKKSAHDRYDTVGGLADDVRRWLNHEPVSAQRASAGYRLGRFVRRNRAAVAAGVLMFTALAVAAGVTTTQMIEARKQRDEARLQAKRAQAQERYANLVMEQFGPGGRPLTREEAIDRSRDILEQQYKDDPRFIAEALIPIAVGYMDLDKTDKELTALRRAESIARRLEDSALLADIDCYMVDAELDKTNLAGAQQRMNEARALLAAAPKTPTRGQVDCMHAEATLADARGDRAAAVERVDAAIALQETIDRTDRTYRNLLAHGQILHLYAGRPKEAYALIQKTLRVLEETDAQNTAAISATTHNQALALNQMGEVRAAMERELEAIAATNGNDPTRPLSAPMAQALGRMYTRMNQPAEGEKWARRALAGTKDGGYVGAQVIALGTLAEALARGGHLDEAASTAAEAALLMTADSDPRERVAAARGRAVVAMLREDAKGAQAAAADLLSALGYPDREKVRSSQTSDSQLLLASRIAFSAGDLPLAADLAAYSLEIAGNLARDPRRSANVGEARLILARVQAAQGKIGDARSSIQGAAAALSAGLAPDHPLALEAASFEATL